MLIPDPQWLKDKKDAFLAKARALLPKGVDADFVKNENGGLYFAYNLTRYKSSYRDCYTDQGAVEIVDWETMTSIDIEVLIGQHTTVGEYLDKRKKAACPPNGS